MKDDIETLSGIDRMTARITELEAERDLLQGRVGALQKALDDRYAEDEKAVKAIFRATGRTRGVPSNVEIVAFYVAEVERLEKEAGGWKQLYETEKESAEAVDLDNISLRAKLERAKEVLEDIEEHNADNCNETRLAVRSLLSELSADAPAQQDGIFRDHSCWKCKDGKESCVVGNPNHCEYPHARND